MSSTRLWLVRVALPAAIAVAGMVALLAGAAALGLSLLATAFVVVFANTLIRLGISSTDDQDREERARGVFDRTGHWPGEA